jgi:hypothetical protein
MKPKYILQNNSGKEIFLFTLVLFLVMIMNPVIISAQQTILIRSSGFTVEKQARSQASWLTLKLNLDKDHVESVYKINLKYLLQSDSLRMTSTETVNKKNLHLEITQKRNSELQSVLTKEQYTKYLSLFANVKKYSR